MSITCTVCGKIKDDTEFGTYKGFYKRKQCNECRRLSDKEARSRKLKNGYKGMFCVLDGFKYCVSCKEILPVEMFTTWISKKTGAEYKKSSCKACRTLVEYTNDYKNNSDRYKKNAANYVINNREKVRENRRKYESKKRESHIYRLNISMYSSISRAMKCGATRSKTKMLKGMPWSTSELANHLEKQFRKGMNWDNYGSVWVVDHIIPISRFTYESETDDDFIACWSLTNLRPLDRIENIIKSAKLLFLI